MTQPHLDLLFPTPVLKIELSKHKENVKNFVPKLTQIFKDNPNNHALWNSMDHSWNAAHDLIDISPIDEEFKMHVRDFISYCLGDQYTGDIQFQGWWNIHDSNMYMEQHTHTDCVVSGIYYLQLDLNKDYPVGFVNPSANLIERWGIESKNSAFESHTLPNFCEIKEGMLVMFPPHIEHFVKRSKIQDNHLRISYAFNAKI